MWNTSVTSTLFVISDCVLRALTPKSVPDPERITDQKQNTELNFGEIEFPVKLKDITKIEKTEFRGTGY